MQVSLVGYALRSWPSAFPGRCPRCWWRGWGGCFTSGTSVCLMALIVDQSDPRERAAHLSYYDAAMVGVSAAAGYFAAA